MQDLTLSILAGGESKRMGSPKSQLVIAGKPILEFILQRLDWRGPTILSTAAGRERPPACERFDREVVDEQKECGPMMGIVASLKSARTDRVVFVPVDMVMVERRQIDFLINNFSGRGVMLDRGGRVEPFPCILDRGLLGELEERISQGRRSVKAIAEVPDVVVKPAPSDWPETIWININTPEDLRGIESILK